ncbi:hypothetical protein SAMN02745245_01166 [Anaerosphaera aminiphila DSM 21120]|uniref:Divalent cation tolerance protein n=1 Tax=Anaerosphaera aminiphila DSM 21120 TaxID=1120995 RepID=A0A1M5SF31_9FIRM|nr:hypothetical protein SAMN02745245_01166 [Anaerosphaera aminiphila DSM 21120]
MAKFLKIELFIPKKYVVNLANALNERSILKYENYDYVYAISNVVGNFRPIEGSNPFIGEIGKVSEVEEVKMEFRIESENLEETKKVIELIHPYEKPVVNIMELIEW